MKKNNKEAKKKVYKKIKLEESFSLTSAEIKAKIFARSFVETGSHILAAREAWGNRLPSIKDIIKYLESDLVRGYIREYKLSLAHKLEISQERIVKELARVAFSNVKDVISSETGRFKDIDILPDDVSAAISRVSYRGGKLNQIQFYNKMDALVKLSQMLGYTEEKEQINQNNININTQINEAQPRDNRQIAKELAFILRSATENNQ